MASKYTILVVLLFSLISLQLIKPGHGSGVHTSIHCLEFERQALLGFARGFNQTKYPFLSWTGRNCCRWEGVNCDNTTGHITGLEVWGLSNDYSGSMPQQLGNLSYLQYLYLYAYVDIGESQSLIMDNAHWLSRLISLQELKMNGVRFCKASGWLDALNMLPSLRSIEFSFCVFNSFPIFLAHVNFTSVLDLSLYSSSTKSKLPSWLFQLSNLQYLDLSHTDFQGPIPTVISNLSSLESLDLSVTSHLSTGMPQTLSSLCKLRRLYFSKSSFNQRLDDLGRYFSGCIRNSLNVLYLYDASLHGNFPDWIAGLKNLTDLVLSQNSLSGPLPKSLGQLSQLVFLDLSHNSLEDELTEEYFANLTRLKYLKVEFNLLVLDVSSDWVPPFQLEYIDMSSCPVGPKFPSWLQTQRMLAELYLSNSRILGSVPEWLWNLTSLEALDLSHNVISSTIPHFSLDILALHLSNTSFQGPIPPNISKIFPNLKALDLSTNGINGSIPSSLCNLVNLKILDISNNNLSGELPPCEKQCPKSLYILSLSNNNIMGGIPSWLCASSSLFFLHLSNNNMSGDFPPSLKSCKELKGLDLGGNRFNGSIPTWVAESMPNLEWLCLRSNMFASEIPQELSQIKNLHVIDLSHNNFFGAIPRSFGNFSLMQTLDPKHWLLVSTTIVYHLSQIFHGVYIDKMILHAKGREDLYERGPLALITIIDLSKNNLSGSIPEELISLPALMSLDLSGNHLTGEISRKIGNMLQLESLDLSRNELSGVIPSTLTNLSFLTFLNLSYNNLTGRIPIGRQLETTVSPSSYISNPFLCGLPLTKICEGDRTTDRIPKDANGDSNAQAPGTSTEGEDEMVWFYFWIAAGFIVGFLIILSVLLLNETSRIVYFQFVDNSYDRMYLAMLLSFKKLKRRFLQG